MDELTLNDYEDGDVRLKLQESGNPPYEVTISMPGIPPMTVSTRKIWIGREGPPYEITITRRGEDTVRLRAGEDEAAVLRAWRDFRR